MANSSGPRRSAKKPVKKAVKKKAVRKKAKPAPKKRAIQEPDWTQYTVHVVPSHGKAHVCYGKVCWCNPTIDDESLQQEMGSLVIIHNQEN